MQPDDDKTQTHVPPTNGTMVSHYRIIEQIGAGGMGEVYLAEDTELNRKVALKFLPPHLCQDADCRARFKREAQAAAKLNHPNIITIFEVSEFNGRPFFAMEHIEGESLADFIKKRDNSLDKIIDLSIQICEGLNKAHESGIIHRDIKPSNILIDQDGRTKILDFGLAAIKGDKKLTKPGATLGTISYMSPEQARGEELDNRSDLFSFGVVLYEMITGQLPFKGEHEPAIVYSIEYEEPEPLARYRTGVSIELQRVLTKALAKQKDERYQHADELAADLRRLISVAGSATGVAKPKRLAAITSVVIIGVLVVILVLKPWRIVIKPSDEAQAVENRLAIMYFDNLADPADSSRLGEIAANLLITNLSESEYLQVVSGQRLYDILKLIGREGVKRVDRSVATQVADKAKAKQMLLGNVLQISPEIILTSQIIDVATGNVMASQKITGTVGENIFPIIDRLSVEVKKDLSLPQAALNESTPPTADLTTHSAEAYRYYLEGVDFLNGYYTQEAEKSFRKALKFDSTFAMVYYRLSILQQINGALEEGKKSIAKAVEYSGKVSQKELYYIKLQEANISGKSTEAIEYSQKIVEQYPEEKEAYLWLGVFYYQDLRKFDEAILYFNKAIEIDSLNEMAYNQLAYVYSIMGDYEKSIWAINKYISLAPDEANPYDTRGDIYAGNGKIDQAIGSYEKALEIKPDFYLSDPPAKLCRLYLFKREYAKAENCYREISSSSDKNNRSYGRTCLAHIPTYQGRFNQALMVLEDGIAADRMEQAEGWENASKYLLKALIHEEKRDLNLAIKEIEKYMEISHGINADDRVTGMLTYTRLLAENKEFEKAEQIAADLKTAIEETDTSQIYLYWNAHGYIELAKGNEEAALVNFKKATRDVPNFLQRNSLASAYLETGRLGEAVTEFEKALSRYDVDRAFYSIKAVQIYYLLGLAYEKSGWDQKAIEKYEEFLDIWKNADPGIKEIDDAKARLARLKGSQ